MRLVKGLDLSFSRIPGVEWVQARKAEGVEVIFQCAWTGGYSLNTKVIEVAEHNLRLIREGGVEVGIYSNATPWYPMSTWYTETVYNCGSEYQNVQHAMIDIEIAQDGLPIWPVNVHDFAARLAADGKEVSTYSADWYVGWWKLQLGDANAVNLGYPYVHARYDGIADPTVSPPRHPLGPLVGKQYRGSHDQNGVSVDADVFDAAFFGGDTMQIDEILTTPEQRDAFARFFTPVQWMDYDRTTNSPIRLPGDNGIPWFGRNGTAPSDMLAVCAGYSDSVHFGTVLAALGAMAPSDPGNLREQIADAPPGSVDVEALSASLSAAFADNPRLLMGLGILLWKAIRDDIVSRMREA